MTYYVVDDPYSQNIHTNQDTAISEAQLCGDCTIRTFRSREDAARFISEKSSSSNSAQWNDQHLTLCDQNLLNIKLESQGERVKYTSYIITPNGNEDILTGYTENGMTSLFLAEILAISDALKTYTENKFYIITENSRLIQIYKDHIKTPTSSNAFPFISETFDTMIKRKITISLNNPFII